MLTFLINIIILANTELLVSDQAISFKTPPSSLWWYNFERGFPLFRALFFASEKYSRPEKVEKSIRAGSFGAKIPHYRVLYLVSFPLYLVTFRLFFGTNYYLRDQ